MKHRLLIYGACLSGLALSGCATIPPDRGSYGIDHLLASRSSVAQALKPADKERDALIDTFVKEPLDATGAVRLALLNNQRINQLYAQLGFAQADVYDASRLSNPSLGYAHLSGGGNEKTTWSISQRFSELLFINLNTRIARNALLQTQQHVAQEVLQLEAEVRKAWYRMASEQLNAQVAAGVAKAAQASAEYAQSLYDAGNISELQLTREQSAAAQAQRQRRQIESDAVAARGELLTLLGVSFDDTRIGFAQQMQLPQASLPDASALQEQALQQRLDIAATRNALQQWQRSLTHTRRWRWFNGLELGAERERDGNSAAMTGPTASIELPLFNQGGGALTRARAQVESLDAQLRMLQLEASNGVVVQLTAVNTAAAMVEDYRQRLIPLQQRAVPPMVRASSVRAIQ